MCLLLHLKFDQQDKRNIGEHERFQIKFVQIWMFLIRFSGKRP